VKVYLVRHELAYEFDKILAVEATLEDAERTLRELGPQGKTGPRSGLRSKPSGLWEWRIEEWWVGGPTARKPLRSWVAAPDRKLVGLTLALGLEEVDL
jgi:hypothetical protein